MVFIVRTREATGSNHFYSICVWCDHIDNGIMLRWSNNPNDLESRTKWKQWHFWFHTKLYCTIYSFDLMPTVSLSNCINQPQLKHTIPFNYIRRIKTKLFHFFFRKCIKPRVNTLSFSLVWFDFFRLHSFSVHSVLCMAIFCTLPVSILALLLFPPCFT